MQVETALFFEPVERIYERVFRTVKPRTPVPRITVQFRKYANANSRIRLQDGELSVHISDLLESAPAPVHEALAYILLTKLYRKVLDPAIAARYRRYLNRSDVLRSLHLVKRVRGRKTFRPPKGRYYDLGEVFEALNFKYFNGLMARPELGWSLKPSLSTLGHYDPSHHVIVLSSVLDSADAPAIVVEFVMFHEMLHLRHPTEHRGPRRCVHTPEFKREERKFEQYRLAKRELKRFVDTSHGSTNGQAV
ncbi:MAG: M48 family metallopeptidase [Acidobacteriaceae bacterium]|nr:M48 family metallopeptidase [Acidobacteriaceae bacterium]